MRYLCLIHFDPGALDALREREVSELNARHLDLNERLLQSGHFIEAEALQRPASATCVRVRDGKTQVTDGPFAETKEMLGGFYLVEARDLNEAIRVAARIPSAAFGTVEVVPCRDLEVDGVPRKASRKSLEPSFNP